MLDGLPERPSPFGSRNTMAASSPSGGPRLVVITGMEKRARTTGTHGHIRQLADSGWAIVMRRSSWMEPRAMATTK